MYGFVVGVALSNANKPLVVDGRFVTDIKLGDVITWAGETRHAGVLNRGCRPRLVAYFRRRIEAVPPKPYLPWAPGAHDDAWTAQP